MWAYCIFFIPLLVDEYLGYFHLLTLPLSLWYILYLVAHKPGPACRCTVWFGLHDGALKPFEPTSEKETTYKYILFALLGEEASRCTYLLHSPKPHEA